MRQPGPDSEKLLELRARTDGQIRNLIESILEKGLAWARRAETEYRKGDAAAAFHSGECAGRADSELGKLLPLLPAESGTRLERGRRELRERLGRLPAEAAGCPRSAAVRAHCA